MQKKLKQKLFILTSPWIVLFITRVLIDWICPKFNLNISWILAFLFYYLSIGIVFIFGQKKFSIDWMKKPILNFKPFPKKSLFIFTIVIPALLPLGAILSQYQLVPPIFYLYILIFALINAPLEELFWRGMLSNLNTKSWFRTLYSAALFSFSHFIFWGYWYKSPVIIIPTVISTFIMGLLWMYFMNKTKNLLYPIISHVVVDIFNLSVAVYYGLVSVENFY